MFTKLRKGKFGLVLPVLFLTLGLGSLAYAEELSVEANTTAINTVWTLIAAFLVFFMQAGFAMVETGFTRAKNACNIMMKNLMDFAIGSIVYWIIGFGIMFGASAFGLFGTDGFLLSAANPSTNEGLWQFAFWMFQAVFAATSATIVSGAMAERTKFSAYLWYSVFITAVIYPVAGHWIWGGGWLSKLGMIDFAGSTVVHSVGGWAALAGAILLGPRLGKYNRDGSSNAIPGHNIPLAALGVFILWFGWFGFNPGSTTSGTNLSIATIAVTTNLAAAAGAILAMFAAWIRFGKPDTSMALNGALAGLVAVTAGCASVSPLSAIIIGAIAGILVVLSVEFIDKVLHIDDPVGAVSVHGVCGAWGTLAVGLFAEAAYGQASGVGAVNGLFFGGGLGQFFKQAVGVTSVFFWVFISMLIIFSIIKAVIGLRVSGEEELKGLDIGEHGMESYAGFEIFTTQ
ncbi:MAG: ammonium transporter [Candidatus Omnitrophica bacterium CG11_big_fil_rev_8_21_14_0_20_42_13]|uniref:Ammonium transporter n=1 Tax=Candidatus Ghiorseimicrobium undicola TaxID=1974746 RepID=A0A2H0LY62_9BACT|nr:MAG: ammonium transporter [Candidatus Omnitrophica bacterium CG11_big_fil_rev_8_21_14_0_20_42_13]